MEGPDNNKGSRKQGKSRGKGDFEAAGDLIKLRHLEGEEIKKSQRERIKKSRKRRAINIEARRRRQIPMIKD